MQESATPKTTSRDQEHKQRHNSDNPMANIRGRRVKSGATWHGKINEQAIVAVICIIFGPSE